MLQQFTNTKSPSSAQPTRCCLYLHVHLQHPLRQHGFLSSPLFLVLVFFGIYTSSSAQCSCLPIRDLGMSVISRYASSRLTPLVSHHYLHRQNDSVLPLLPTPYLFHASWPPLLTDTSRTYLPSSDDAIQLPTGWRNATSGWIDGCDLRRYTATDWKSNGINNWISSELKKFNAHARDDE